MDIRFTDELPKAEDYRRVYLSVGWPQIDEFQVSNAQIEKALRNSYFVLSAYAQERLVALARILSDGVFYALAVDVIVDPEYQGRGIGTELMKRLKDHCRKHGIHGIHLFAANGKAPFYEKLGFHLRDEDNPGMQLKFDYSPEKKY